MSKNQIERSDGEFISLNRPRGTRRRSFELNRLNRRVVEKDPEVEARQLRGVNVLRVVGGKISFIDLTKKPGPNNPNPAA